MPGAEADGFRQVFEGSDAVMLLIDPESGTVEDANRAAGRFYGYPPGGLAGRPLAEIEAGPPGQGPLARHRLADGQVRIVKVQASPVDLAGRRLRLLIVQDVTEGERAAAELRALQADLERRIGERTREILSRKALLREALALNESILATSPVGIGVYRQDGQCVLANPSFARMVGASEGQLLAQNFRHLPSWRGSGLLEAAERVLAGGRVLEYETRITTSFGRQLWLSCHFCRFLQKEEPHLLLMLHDITEEMQAKEALLERERTFRTLADNMPDNVLQCDLRGRILYLNRTLEQTLGRSLEELRGKTHWENYPDGRYDTVAEAMLQVGATGESQEVEQVVPGPDGKPHYHLIRIVAERGPGGQPVSVLAVGRDLTRMKTIEEELRLAASVFHNSAEGVLITDREGRILSVNPAFTDITGYPEGEALGRKPSLLRSDHHGPDFYREMWSALNRDGRWQGEIWNRRKSGEAYLEWLTINRIDDSAGRPDRYVAVFHDITELRRKDERIRHLAFHDALTGLPNRVLMQDRLHHGLARARREDGHLAVIFIDLDRFKAINDGLGHDVGDLLLQETASRLRGRLRAADTVARLGGDEFVVLMEELQDAGDCAGVVQELIAAISRPMALREHVVQVGASVGIALFPEDGGDTLELMKRADMAMYAAKSAGRNTYRFFQPVMLAKLQERLALEMDLRRAIAAGQLELHYQPKILLATGEVQGLEALVRWHHPAHGTLGPADFISLAEESGLIREMGDWVLDEACRQTAAWQAAGRRGCRIAVNVSVRQLEAGDLAEAISVLTRRHGITPADLEIELTESAVMTNPESIVGLLARLRRQGTTIAVDDFGTGYSSLAYLRRLPIDALKIDRSFVIDADHNGEDAEIVKTIVALGQSLKLSVVAEGVETAGHADLLRCLGCGLAQGYLYSRPLPARDIEDWLDRAG